MITYEFVDKAAFREFFPKLRAEVFKDDVIFDPTDSFGAEEKATMQENATRLSEAQGYTLVARDGEKIVGWSYGLQKGNVDFTMVNSGVLETYRRQGIYTELMHKAVDKITEMGFHRISSRHKVSNNAVIIPKLKFGFVITGIEILEIFGPCVTLSYHTKPLLREMLDVRMGSRRMGELEKYLS